MGADMRRKALKFQMVLGLLCTSLLLPITEGFAEDPGGGEATVSLVRQSKRLLPAAGLAAIGNILALREGTAIVGLNSLSLRQQWTSQQDGLTAGPFRAGENLYAITKNTFGGGGRDAGPRITYASLIKLDSKTGSVIQAMEVETSSVQAIFGCRAPAFLFNKATLFWNTQNVVPTKLVIPGNFTGDLKDVNWQAIWLSAHRLVVAGKGTVRAADLINPTQMWSSTLSGKVKRIQGCGSTLLVELEGGDLVGMEESSGRVLWHEALGRDRTLVSFGIDDSFIIAPGGARERIDSQNGARQALAPLNPGPRSLKVAWSSSEIIIIEEAVERALKIYDSTSGKLLWSVGPSEARSLSHSSLSGKELAREFGSLETENRQFDVLNGYIGISSASRLLQVLGISHSQPSNGVLSAANSGNLNIKTDPEDAFVWIDGFLLPRDGRQAGLRLAVGAHLLKVFHPDREDYEATIEVKGEGSERVDVVLERLRTVGLSITTNPDGAMIYIEDINSGYVTPHAFSDYAPGQVVNIHLFKLGYGEFRTQAEIGREGNQISEKLRVRSLLGSLFVRSGKPRFGTLMGWNARDIRAGGVMGEPVRAPSDGVGLGGEAKLDIWLLPALALWGRVDLDLQELEEEGGFWISRGEPRNLQVGLSYLEVGLNSAESSPPSQGWSGPDRSAPLERWHHPIPGVLVSNSGRDYLVAHIRARPQADLLIELAVGKLLGTRLHGRALVNGPDGHLTRDPERFYDVRSRSGDLIDISLRKGLGAFRLGKIFPSMAFEARFRQRTIDFRIAKERGQEITLGLGLMLF
jgi:hypothetical protein